MLKLLNNSSLPNCPNLRMNSYHRKDSAKISRFQFQDTEESENEKFISQKECINKLVAPVGWSDWWNFKVGMVSHDSDNFGVYELADDSEAILYIGGGKVRTELLAHLTKSHFPLATRYRIDLSSTEEESRIKERHLPEAYKSIRNGKLPLYNQNII